MKPRISLTLIGRSARMGSAGNEDLPAVAAIILISCLGYSGLFAMPMWVGPVGAQMSLSAFAVGAIASAEIGAATLASLATSRIVTAARIQWGAALGLVLIGLANLWSAAAQGPVALLSARLLAGTGEGLAMAFANASIVTTATPDRYFAWSQMGLGVFGLAL